MFSLITAKLISVLDKKPFKIRFMPIYIFAYKDFNLRKPAHLPGRISELLSGPEQHHEHIAPWILTQLKHTCSLYCRLWLLMGPYTITIATLGPSTGIDCIPIKYPVLWFQSILYHIVLGINTAAVINGVSHGIRFVHYLMPFSLCWIYSAPCCTSASVLSIAFRDPQCYSCGVMILVMRGKGTKGWSCSISLPLSISTPLELPQIWDMWVPGKDWMRKGDWTKYSSASSAT